MTNLTPEKVGVRHQAILPVLVIAAVIGLALPVWAEDGIDLQALRDSYQMPGQPLADQNGGGNPLPRLNVLEDRAPSPTIGAGPQFPRTIDELIALAEQELAGRPERNVLEMVCELVAQIDGAEEAWSRNCQDWTEPTENEL